MPPSDTPPPTASVVASPEPSGAHPIPSSDVLHLLPPWARAAAVLGPLLVAPVMGGAGGYLGGGQAAAQERAILATKVERLQEDIDKLDQKIDRLLFAAKD